ncbi:DoxX family protein [Reichenbachiella sp. MALMAid0571]|uniref:DoxX family protein n=1 Tax=Reichenbachiella sp. MALMAid0571 TaxID=3143939 RepID=UPI0032DF5947
MKKNRLLIFLPRIIVAFILLQTLFFKFGIGGNEALQESKEIFGIIALRTFGSADQEAVIRIGTGIAELAASILILLNATAYIGALVTIGLMGGAILSHLLFLGIEVKGDNGQLFIMAMVVLLTALIVLYRERKKVPQLFKKN